MKRRETESCIIELADEATREYYAAGSRINDCGCDDCGNFRAFAPNFPNEVKEFFRSLGIDDMRVLRELMPYTMHDGKLIVGGFYHLVGRMEGGFKPQPAPDFRDKLRKMLGLKPSKYRDLPEDDTRESGIIYMDLDAPVDFFDVYFKVPCDLLPEDFPENAVQLEISTTIPWVIDKKYRE